MKADLQFGLENAKWPALLVDAQGVVRRGSQGAALVFGKVIERADLRSLWGAGNEFPAEQFVPRAERSLSQQMRLHFLVKGGATAAFSVFISPFIVDQQKYFILQLLPDTVTPPSSTRPPAEETTPTAEALAHKQKLDCALQLARTVALDFNNALTTVLVHVSHILDQMEPGHPWRTSLVEVEKAAEKAAEIASDLAAFSRQEKDTRVQQVGNLNSILRRSMDLFQKPGDTQKIQWLSELQSHPFTVAFDEAKMQQAFVKILENSVQALGGPGGRIHVATRNLELREATRDQHVTLAPGAFVCVEIQDDGPGMAPEILPRVFEPFFTTKPGHRGLGLAWVYGIVTNHGGSVTVSSTPAKGTSVRLYIPATTKVLRDTQINKAELHGTETILMVDDDEQVLAMGQMLLSSFGYKVITANCGQKAMEIVRQSEIPIDLLITDLVMPRMSGRELIENIRRVAPNLRTIYSSGYIRWAGEDSENFLLKPYTSKALLAKVRQVLTTG